MVQETKPRNKIRARSTLYDPVTGLIVTDRHDERLATYDVDHDQWETIPIDLGSRPSKANAPAIRAACCWPTTQGLTRSCPGVIPWRSSICAQARCRSTLSRSALRWSRGTHRHCATPKTPSPVSGIIHDFGGGALWAYDPTQPGWELIYGLSEDFETGPGAVGIRIYDAMVYDTINGRLVVIGGRVKIDGEWETIDDVWAFDIDSEEWTELVPASNALDSE